MKLVTGFDREVIVAGRYEEHVMSARHSESNCAEFGIHAEISAILARGVLRLSQFRGDESPADSSEIGENPLEFSSETRLSVVSGTQRLGPRDDGDEAWDGT
jgi:hypothetical protein